MKKDDQKKNPKEVFTNIWQKTSDISKKAADSVSKSAKDFAEYQKKKKEEDRIKKYNPLFPSDFKSEKFNLPNVIEIVDDAIRKNIDICEGAIGWTDKANEVEVFHLYDEWISESELQFVPVAKCDTVYCVDPFDRKKFIDANLIFSKSNEEKLAELENIAYLLGAKTCSIEIVEADSEIISKKATANLSINGQKASASTSSSVGKSSQQSSKTISQFKGCNAPQRPTLKWFAYDENIKGLIEMRCSDTNSIKSKSLELNGSYSATMSKKVACAIDKILKIKGSMSMEKQAVKEHSRKLIFEVDF